MKENAATDIAFKNIVSCFTEFRNVLQEEALVEFGQTALHGVERDTR